MPIGSSGALSLSDIQTEFGGSNPISLSEYYAGGSNVPSGISGDNGAIPSSGAIDISDFSVERVLGKNARHEPYVL